MVRSRVVRHIRLNCSSNRTRMIIQPLPADENVFFTPHKLHLLMRNAFFTPHKLHLLMRKAFFTPHRLHLLMRKALNRISAII